MFIEQFRSVMKEKHSHMLIMGDFNYPEIDWNLQMSHASENHPSQNFITCYKDWFLYQHVTQPTHYRAQQNANILDLIMTTEEDMVDSLHYGEPIGKSHHVVLDWTCNCYGHKSQSKSTKYFYDKGDFESMKNCFKSCDWERHCQDVLWMRCGKSYIIRFELQLTSLCLIDVLRQNVECAKSLYG